MVMKPGKVLCCTRFLFAILGVESARNLAKIQEVDTCVHAANSCTVYKGKTKDVHLRGPSNLNLGLFVCCFCVYRDSKGYGYHLAESQGMPLSTQVYKWVYLSIALVPFNHPESLHESSYVCTLELVGLANTEGLWRIGDLETTCNVVAFGSTLVWYAVKRDLFACSQ